MMRYTGGALISAGSGYWGRVTSVGENSLRWGNHASGKQPSASSVRYGTNGCRGAGGMTSKEVQQSVGGGIERGLFRLAGAHGGVVTMLLTPVKYSI